MTGGARATLLLLADGRLPAGGHAHSGGVEAAVGDGRIAGVDDLTRYLEGRLATAGLVDAAIAAAGVAACATGAARTLAGTLSDLDAEATARIAVPAVRRAARAQGRGLIRVGRRCWPGPAAEVAAGVHPDGPLWPVALAAVAADAGLDPLDAALVAAQSAVTSPAWAAVRLLGLDPLAVTAVLAGLAPAVEAVAGAGVRASTAGLLVDLPSVGGPLTDVAAEAHEHWEMRLFAS